MTPYRQPVDPALRRFLDEQNALATEPVRSAAEARARMRRHLENRVIPGLPNRVTAEDHLITDRGGPPLRVRSYAPPRAAGKPAPTLVYLHGGGWVAGSIETHDPFCRLLAPLADVCILSVDYRLAPEQPFPAGIEDARTALFWAAEHAGKWGGDAGLLCLGGDSSGANLAAVTANRLAVEAGAPRLQALLLLYPVADHPSGLHPSYAENSTGYGLDAAAMQWYWAQYAPEIDPNSQDISPLRAVVLPPLPPTLVATAEYDVLRDEGIAYARKLAEAGVAVTHMHAPDMHHNFPVSPATVARFPQCEAALGRIAAFLRAVFA